MPSRTRHSLFIGPGRPVARDTLYDNLIRMSYTGVGSVYPQRRRPIMPTQDYPAQDRVETRIQFRAGGKLFAFLGLRSMRMGTPSPDLQARVEIEIWRDVMAAELRRIPLTVAEASCLAGILKGHRPSR